MDELNLCLDFVCRSTPVRCWKLWTDPLQETGTEKKIPGYWKQRLILFCRSYRSAWKPCSGSFCWSNFVTKSVALIWKPCIKLRQSKWNVSECFLKLWWWWYYSDFLCQKYRFWSLHFSPYRWRVCAGVCLIPKIAEAFIIKAISAA